MKVKRFNTKYRPFSKGMEEGKLGSYVQYYDYGQLEKKYYEMYEALKELNRFAKCCETNTGFQNVLNNTQSLLKDIDNGNK